MKRKRLVRAGRKDDYEWLKERLPKVFELGKRLSTVYPDVIVNAHPWTLLKLLLHSVYVPLYTSIIKPSITKQRFYPMVYIDLFSGCGLNKISTPSSGDVLMPGSPILASFFARSKFDYFVCVEKNAKRANALKARLKEVPDGYASEPRIILGDCNEVIDEICFMLDVILDKKRRSHYLAFIDPYGFELSWFTLEKLLKRRGDLWILMQAEQIPRMKGTPKGREKLKEFFGDYRFMNFNKPTEFVVYYCHKISRVGSINVRREFVIPCPIKLGIRTRKGRVTRRYYLIFATRKTKQGSRWIKAVEKWRERIKNLTPKLVERAIGVIQGRERDLIDFLEPLRPEGQRLLEEFQ